MTRLPAQAGDFPAWYGEVVRRAGLAEHAPVRGAMVIKPYGYAIWEAIQRELDDRIKATGHENLYFPMLVPASVLAQEGDLIEGFAPEVAVVTEAGGEKLEEPLAVRPTSEALIWSTYARWLQSYRDLPLLYNQWANVVRWEHPHATSWGATTRLVGGVVMVHGDERGLRLPPRVAPQQVVVVPILRDEDRADVLQAAAAVADELRAAGVRVRVDDRPEYRPGFKFNESELKGVPLRVELGGRDLAAGAVTVARRDTGDKRQIPLPRVAVAVGELLEDVQASLFAAAHEERERRTLRDPSGYDELIEYLRDARGFVSAPWCGGRECEVRVKDDSSATIRCLPLTAQAAQARACVCCGRAATADAVWAQAY